MALGSHWGRIGVAFGWLSGAYQLAINTLCGGFDVALMWLWVAVTVCQSLIERCAPWTKFQLTLADQIEARLVVAA